jgi:mannosyltransferase
VIAGAVARLHGIGHSSLWTDEAFSLFRARRSALHVITWVTDDVNPPLYYLIVHGWIRLAGASEAALRFPSACFGVLTIPLMYSVGARTFDRATGLVAAILLAATTFHVTYAQEARMYTLFAFLSLLSWDWSYRLMTRADRRSAAGYVIATVLMLHTHVYGVFVMAAEALSVLLLWWCDRDAWRRVWKLAAVVGGLAVLLFLPWILTTLVTQMRNVATSFWVPRLGLIGVWSALSVYCGSWGLSKLLRALALVAAVAGLVSGSRPGGVSRRWTTATLLGWIAGPLVLPWIISQVSTPIFVARYTISASLPFYLLAARGVTLLPGRIVRAGLVALVTALNVIALHGYFSVDLKDHWREAAASLTASAAPGDLLLFYRAFGQLPFDYYVRRADVVEAPCVTEGAVMPTPPQIVAQVDAETARHDRVWLVASNPDDTVLPVALAELTRRYPARTEQHWRGVDVYLFERPPSAVAASAGR